MINITDTIYCRTVVLDCSILYHYNGLYVILVHNLRNILLMTFCRQVDKHRDHLINYIIFLRITPFLPNWFINITSPVINVPLGVFFIGTFLGKTSAVFNF